MAADCRDGHDDEERQNAELQMSPFQLHIGASASATASILVGRSAVATAPKPSCPMENSGRAIVQAFEQRTPSARGLRRLMNHLQRETGAARAKQYKPAQIACHFRGSEESTGRMRRIASTAAAVAVTANATFKSNWNGDFSIPFRLSRSQLWGKRTGRIQRGRAGYKGVGSLFLTCGRGVGRMRRCEGIRGSPSQVSPITC